MSRECASEWEKIFDACINLFIYKYNHCLFSFPLIYAAYVFKSFPLTANELMLHADLCRRLYEVDELIQTPVS